MLPSPYAAGAAAAQALFTKGASYFWGGPGISRIARDPAASMARRRAMAHSTAPALPPGFDFSGLVGGPEAPVRPRNGLTLLPPKVPQSGVAGRVRSAAQALDELLLRASPAGYGAARLRRLSL